MRTRFHIIHDDDIRFRGVASASTSDILADHDRPGRT